MIENNFFSGHRSEKTIKERLFQISQGKVGFYSVGLYPLSLAYNCAMHNKTNNILLAPRPGRDLFGAFSESAKLVMDEKLLEKIYSYSVEFDNDKGNYHSLSDLIKRCEIVFLSSNSKYVEEDLKEASSLRKELKREHVLLACLVGSFGHDDATNSSYVLCDREVNLAFFSGFHRHGSLRNPLDSFTANFCHPDPINAFLGAHLLNKLSPNIQVSPGIHNVEGQYVKAAKNISSIFAGFGHSYHQGNPGLLPNLLTLLLDQCIDQASTVSMKRSDRKKLYKSFSIPISQLGYRVEEIRALTLKDGEDVQIRDHTFSQLSAIISDVRGSMMMPASGKPTRNFQVGEILACKMSEYRRCPNNINELILWCEEFGLKSGGLEGINSLKYWPQILKTYSISINDSSMINLLYMAIFSDPQSKKVFYKVLTDSRELTKYCKDSVRDKNSRNYIENSFDFSVDKVANLFSESILNSKSLDYNAIFIENNKKDENNFMEPYMIAIRLIDDYFQ